MFTITDDDSVRTLPDMIHATLHGCHLLRLGSQYHLILYYVAFATSTVYVIVFFSTLTTQIASVSLHHPLLDVFWSGNIPQSQRYDDELFWRLRARQALGENISLPSTHKFG